MNMAMPDEELNLKAFETRPWLRSKYLKLAILIIVVTCLWYFVVWQTNANSPVASILGQAILGQVTFESCPTGSPENVSCGSIMCVVHTLDLNCTTRHFLAFQKTISTLLLALPR